MPRRDPSPSRTHSREELELIDAYWRAANYLSVGQIYLLANPLLRQPLLAEHIKPRLLGHWGTTPGLNLLYAHLNRVITERDLNQNVPSNHRAPTAVTWGLPSSLTVDSQVVR